VGAVLSWLVSLLAHVRFRRAISAEQLKSLGLRSRFGAAGSIFGLVAIVAVVASTWWVQQSSVAAKSAVFYIVILSGAYWLVKRNKVARR